MKQEYKIQCYQDSYQELKNIPQVKNLNYPEEKKNLDFSCDISDIHVEYSMRLAIDFLTIRGSRSYPGLSDSELTEIGKKIVEGTSVKFTAYSETLIFQLSLPLVGVADEDAKIFAVNESSKFFHFLLNVVGITEISEPVRETKNKEEDAPCKGEDKGKLSQEKIFSETSVSQESFETPCHARVKESYSIAESFVSKESQSKQKNITQSTNYSRNLDESNNENKDDIYQKKESIVAEDKSISCKSSYKDIQNESVNVISEKQYEEDHEISKSERDMERVIDKKQNDHYRKQTEARRNELEYLITMRSENNKKAAELEEFQEELKVREIDLFNKENALRNTLLQLEEEKKSLATELNQIEEIKKNAEEKTEKFLKLLEEKEKKADDLKNDNNDLQSKYNKSQNELNKIKQSNTKLRETTAEKEACIEDLHKEINQFEQLLEEESVWNKKLQDEKDDLMQKIAGKDFEIKNIKHEISVVKENIEKEKQNAIEDTKKSYEKLLSQNENSFKEKIQSIRNQHACELEELRATQKDEIKILEQNLMEKDSLMEQRHLQEVEKYEILNGEYLKVVAENQSLEKEVRKIKMEQTTLEKMKIDNKDRFSELENELSAKCGIIKDLESRLQQYRNGSSLGTPDEVLEDFAETRKENRRLLREIEDLKEECNMNSSELLKQIGELNLIIEKKEQEDKIIATQNTIEYKTKQIISETASMGVMMNAIETGEIVGKRDGCEITVYPNKDMFICKTTVTRASRYLNDISKWNEEDITEMYYSTKREIICKKKFDNISLDLQKIIRRFVLLK